MCELTGTRHPTALPQLSPTVVTIGTVGAYFLREGLLRHPEHVAVIGAAESWTYRQLADRAAGLAQDLSERGLRRGDVVLVESDPIPRALIAILACWSVGAIYVPLAPETTP